MKSSGNPPSLLRFCLLMLMLVSYTDTFVIGAPKGGHVVSGTASFTQDGNLTVITAGNRSVINYTGFDIGKNETVQFIQPGAHATVLNRVTTADPTNIFGRLESNGIVVISNPYGVFFQNGSVVNVGGLVAGAGKISNADFTAGKIHFTDLNGDVRNDGVIAADNQIALMGANVVNTGAMTAAHGLAMMVSGPDVYVGDKNGNIFVQANGKALRAAAAATGASAASAGSVTNSGTVAAPRVVLGAGDMYSTAIVNSGLLQGRSIAVNAGRNGSATVGGTLDASSAHNPTATGKGGNINVLGGKLTLQGATLDASGDAGGGNVRVGGDFHGGGTLAHADTTTVDAATTIKADATGAAGDGGTVVLWSNNATLFNGRISASGGSTGGNGGSAEVSSGNALSYTGLVDLHATAGTTGSLLLDPKNITVDGSVGVFDPSAATFANNPGGNLTISAGALGVTLGTAAVTLQANTDITFTANVTAIPIVTGTGALTLEAGRSIFIGDPVGNTPATLTLQGAFSATTNAGTEFGTNPQFRDAGRAVFTMVGTSTISAPGGVSITGGTLAQSGNADNTAIVATTVDANTGDMTLGSINTNGGTAGVITVNNSAATVAAITVNGALSSAPTLPNTAGGNISLQAATGLTLTSTVDASGTGTGNGGLVGLSAGAGDFLANATTDTITSNSTGTGSGGNIALGTTAGNLTADGAIVAASLGTGAGAGHGGAVQLSSTTGTVTAATITTSVAGPGNATAGSGTAGNVTVFATGLVTVGAINATANAGNAASTIAGSGGTVSLTSGGAGINASTVSTLTNDTNTAANGGGVTLNANGGGLTVGAIDSTAPQGNAGGAVQLTAGNGALSASTISTSGAGQGGTVQMTSAGDLTPGAITTSSTGGNGGNVTLTITNAGVAASTLTIPNISTGATSAATLALSGNILINNNSTVAGSGVTATGTLNTSGNTTSGPDASGGNITVNGPGDINFAQAINANGVGTGAGGTVSLTAGGALGTNTISATAAGAGGGGVSLMVGTTLSPGTITTTSANGPGGNVALTINNSATAASLTLPVIATRGATASGSITAINNNTNAGSALNVNNALDTTPTGASGTGGAVTLSAANGTLTVGNTINASGAGAGSGGAITLSAPIIVLNNTLTTTGTGGTVSLDGTGAIAASTASAISLNSTITGFSLTIGAGTTTFNDGSAVTTSGGGQTYGGPVTLALATAPKLTTLTDTGSGDIQFSSTVDSAATATGQSLTLNTAGNEIFGGALGSAFALNNLTTDAVGTVGGAARFNFALPTGTTNTAGVTLTGALLVNDGVNFGVTGGASVTAPSISTGGAQTYQLAATVGATTYLTSGSTLAFNSTLGSATTTAQALTLNTAGKITLGGGVGTGALNPLASLTTVGGQEVDVNGGGVTTSAIAGQTYSGAVVLGLDTILTANASGPVTFDSTVDGSHALTIATGGLTRFENNVGNGTALTSLSVSGPGGISFTPPTGSPPVILTVKTSAIGGQNYTGPVTLGADLTLTAAANGPVVFGSTIDGSHDLTIFTGGVAKFGGNVGVGTPLSDLNSDSAGGVTFTNPLTVNTSGMQSYAGLLTLGGTTALHSTLGTVTAGSLAGGGFDLTVTANGSTFGTITGGGNLTFADGVAAAVFNGPVTATSLTRTGTGLTDITAASVTTASTATGQNYGGPVRLEVGTTFSDTASGPITFQGAINGASAGAQTLAVVTGGATTFDGTVGAVNPLGSVTVGSAAVNGGTTVFSSGGFAVTTLNNNTSSGTGKQTYFNAVQLTLDTTLISTFTGPATAGGDITFNGKVDSAGATPYALAVDTSGNEIFNNLVGSVHPLRSLATDTTGTVGGQVQFNMSVVGQASGVAGVRLGTGGALFGDLAVFNVLGSSSAKVPATISGDTGTNNPSITSTGTQSQFYMGGVTDQQNTVIQGPSILVAGTFNAGNKALTFDLSQQALTVPLTLPGTTFTNLASLASVGDAGTTINGNITTTGYQYYGGTAATGGVTLATDATLQSSGGGAIGFGGTINGAHTLEVDTAGSEYFNGLVGNVTPLTNLYTDHSTYLGGAANFQMNLTGQLVGTAGVHVLGQVIVADAANFGVTGSAAGTTVANSLTSVLSGGVQQYSGTSTLGQDTVLTDTAATINLIGAVDGARNLTLNSPVLSLVQGRVGGTTPLLSLTTNNIYTAGGFVVNVSSGGSVAAPTITTVSNGTGTGAQTYDGYFQTGFDTVLSSAFAAPVTGGGAVMFNGKVDGYLGAHPSLTVLAGPGQTVFAPGATVNAAGLNIGGAQVTFNQPVGSVSALNVLTVGRNGTLTGVTPTIDINNGLITTTTGQTYTDGVLLSADTTLKDTNSQNIAFNSTVDGLDATARSLTLNTAGSVTFGGVVGGVHALSLLSSTATLGTTFSMTLVGSVPGVTVGTGGISVFGPAIFNTTNSTLASLARPTLQSGGIITLNGAVTLSSDTSLYSTAAAGSGDITFSGAVNGAHGLALNAAGNEIFNANAIVGGTTPLLSLTTDALITAGGQTQFLMNVTGAPSGVAGVRVGSGGLAVHDGVQFNVTGGTLVNPTVLALNGGTQAYGGAASLAVNTFLVGDSSGTTPTGGVYSGGGGIGFGTTVAGTAGTTSLTIRTGAGQTSFFNTVNVKSLQVTGANVTFGGAVSLLNALSIAPNPGAGISSIDLNGGTVTTSLGQTYSSPLTLSATTTLADTGSSAISLLSVDGAFALTVNTGGLTTFGGVVGGATPLVSLTTDAAGTTRLSGGAVNTTGFQSYGDAVTLGANTTLASANTAGDGGAITLGKAVDGAFALTVNTSGLTTFGGVVGGATPLVSLTTDAAGTTRLSGGAVNTTGFQSYGDAVTLGTNTTLASANTAGDGGAITLGKAVDGAFALTVNTSGLTTFGGLVGGATPLVSLTTDAAGTTRLSGGAVNTTGFQSYGDAVTLGTNTTLASANTAGDGGAITLGKAVDGAFALTVNTSGLTTFGGVVGGATPLVSLTTDALGTTRLSGGAVSTTGFQSYGDAVTLAANTTLTTTGTDPLNSAITFNSTIGGTFTLTTVTAGGNTVFGANSGSVPGSLLTGLTTSANGTTIFNNAALTTNGTQTYQGPVVVQSATRVLSLTATTGSIVFDQTLNSTALNSTDLTLTTTAAGSSVTFAGAVGGGITAPSATAFNSLTVTSPAIHINGGVVNTASANPRGLVGTDGTQTYNGPVFLGMSTVFVGTTVTATGVIDAQGNDLTLTLSGLASVPLAGIINVHNFTSNGTGGTDITGNFLTTGFQHYDNFVTVSGPATLTAGVVAGQDSIFFGSTINSAGHFALSLNTSGPITFAGAVGNTGALGSLATLGTGTTNINGGAVTTVGDQTFAGPVVLGPTGGQTTLTSTGGGTIKFGSTLDGNTAAVQLLTTSTTGAVEFDAAVGGSQALQSLTANNIGTTNINGGSITTTGGGQNYQGPVVINTAATTTLADTTTGNLTFGSTLNNTVAGTPTLTLSTGGNITFTGQVGNAGLLGSLTASAGGTIFVNGGLVQSTGSQTYNNPNAALLGALSLGNTTTFASANGGNITFHSTVDGTTAGAQGLTVNTAGNEVFDGIVGGTALANLATDGGAGTTQFNMPISGAAAAGVHVTGNVTIGDGVLFASTGSSFAQPSVLSGSSQTYSGGSATQNVFLVGGGTFNNTGTLNFGGTHNLSLRFGGLATVPSGLANVRNFFTDGAGGTRINGTFTTTGTQTYSDAVSLAGAPSLTSVGNLTFNNPVNGNAPLMLNATGPGAQVIFNLNALVGNTTPIGALTSSSTGGTVFGMAAGSTGGVNAASVTVASGPVIFDVANATAAHPSIQTTGAQSYQGAATLPLDTVLVSSGGGAISFGPAGTIDSATGTSHALTLATTGAQTFTGLIGSTTPLSSLTTGTGVTNFNMTVGAALAGVRLNGPLTTDGATTFNEAGSSLTNPSVLTLGNGAQTYGGTVTLLGAVTVLNSANTEPATGTFHGGGVITFNGDIVSGVPVVAATGTPELDVRAGAGFVEFDAPVSTTGDFAPGGASVIFHGAVGPIGTFTVLPNDLNTGIGGIDINGGSVTTGGAQIFSQPTVLSANTVLQAGGNVTFATTLDGSNLLTNTPYTLDIRVNGGVIAFNGIVGGIVPLENLTTENVGATVGTAQFNMVLPLTGTGLGGVNVINAVNIGTTADFEAVGLAGGTVPTIRSGVTYLGQVGTGTQTYGGAVVLGLSSVLHQTTVLQDIAAAGNITFNGRINGKADGDAGLSVNSYGDEVFNQLVGDTHTLASLSTDDVSGGTGATRFNLDLTQAGVAAGVRVAGTVSVNDLAVFNATGGLVRPTILSGGAQNYALNATVRQGTVLTIDPTLRTAGLPADNGNIIFQSRVDSGATAQNLQVNSPGNEIFKGLVGYTSPLASLTTDANGPATGQTRFLMTLPVSGPFGSSLGGVNVNGNVTANDGVFFQVANSASAGQIYTPSVISGGTQTYVGPATLAATTVLVSTSGNVAFNSTVDSDSLATPQALTIFTTAAGSAITFGQAVGGTFALASLRTEGLGTTQINGGSVTTTDTQTFGQAVTLGQDTVLRSTNTIDFEAALDGTHNLEADAASVNFETVGNTSPLLNLTVNAPTAANFFYGSGITPGNGSVNLAGRLTVNGPAIFRSATAGNVLFVRTGVMVPGYSLPSAQDYFGAFQLLGNATFTDLQSGAITFHQTVDGFAPGSASDLTASTGGTISFLGSVGGGTPLTSLTTSNLGLASGQTFINGGSVTTTTGAQTYNDAVTLGAATTLTSLPGTATTGGDIVFALTLNSNGAATPQALTLNTSGRTVFGGAVGAVNALASLTTDNEGAQDLGTFINGGSVTTVNTGAPGAPGTQTYNDAVTLGAATTLTSNAGGSVATGGKIAFTSTLESNGAATPQALTVNTSGRTVFGGAVGAVNALASLTTDNEGTQDLGTFINGGSVKTTGAQTYNDGVAIGAATTLTSTAGGDVAFNSTLDSNTTGAPQALTINTSGRTIFGGAVGAANALASLTTDNEGTQDLGTFLNGGSVKTTGAQTYNDAVTLGANAVLSSSANGTLVFNNTVNGAFALTLNTGGQTIFNRAVGGAVPLTGLTTDNAGAVGEVTQFNMTVGNNAAGVVVNGPVTINDAVLFNVKGSSLTQPGILTLGNRFSQIYNGLATLGTSTFLVSASALPVAGGGSISFNSPQGIVASGGADLSVRAGVGTNTLTAAVNVGTLDLGGASANFLGPITLPGTLSVEPNDATGGGSVAFTGSTLTTTGAQIYNAAFVLGSDTVATSTGGGTITFNSTVDGTHALTLNTRSNEVFNGRVGGATPLLSLTTDDPAANTTGGHVVFNVAGSTTAAPSVTTTGFQTYHDAATLRADTVLASTGAGVLTFGSTVDSDATATPRALTLNTASDEVFNGQVGSIAPLASLTTDDPAANTTAGRTIFNLTGPLPTTPTVTTVGAQTYHDAVLVQTGTTLTSTGGGALTFASAVDGPASLTLDTAGLTTFRGAVGSSITLASLTTRGGGAVALNGRTVTTTGLQTYGGVVTLGANSVLTSTATGGGISFATTLDSDARTTPRSLTLNAVGNETFNGRVGSINALASLTTDDPAAHVAGGSVIFHIGGSTPDAPGVTTVGAQTYNDAALLQTNTVLASTGGGALTFTSTVDGPFALTLDTAGNEVFGGTVGGTQALTSLTTDANSVGGQVVFGLPGASAALSVTTTGGQTYNDAVLLQTGATLTSTGNGTLNFASTVDGPFALSLNSKGDELFNGQIGHNQALASLSTDADTGNADGNVRFFFTGTNDSPSVTTTGAQAYHDPAVLHADTVLASTGGGRLSFLSTVDNNALNNAHALTLNSSGDEFFGGLIGAAKAIGSLTTDAAGAVGGQAQFAMNLTGQTGNAAGVNGTVTVNDAVAFNAPGVTANNVLIQSTGAQSYNGPATLGADAILVSSGGGTLAFASTVNGPHNLTLNTGGTTIFNGAIGGGSALAGLTTQGGPVRLNAGAVTTTGAQVYAGPVTLVQKTALTSTANGINFGSTVDGGVALTLSTANATTFSGAVGGTTPLTNLTAADGSAVVVNGGLVATRGLQTYGGAVTVNGPGDGTTILKASNDETNADVTQHGNILFKQAVTVNSGSLLVQGRRILAEANANISVAGAGNLDLEADDVLILQGGSYGSVNGNVILNDPQNGLVPNSVNRATIFLTNQRTLFHGANFDMGYLQNLFSQGSVAITVGGTATLSDIAANGTLNVSAGSILLRARAADPSRGAATGGADDGLNFVARTSINFGDTTIRYDNSHSANDVANFVTTNGQVTVNRDRSVGISLFQDPSLTALFAQANANTHFSDDTFGTFSNFPLQPISGGTQTIDTAAALSGALPDQKPLDVAVDITVTAGQLEELKKLGIHPRRAARQERLSLSSKRALFAQLVDGQDQDNYGLLQPIKGGISRLVPSDYVVVVDRMSEREVQSILTAFEELYGRNKEKAAPIGESFNTAFGDYTTEKQTGDPAGFGPYLLEKPGKYPEVDKAVRGFDNLFGYIESLGLTSKEQAKSKEHIASDLQVAGVSPEDMVKVIDALRAKIPKNQKAPSTKLPPSPPAAAPAPGATNPAPPPTPKATPPLKTARQPAQEPARKTVRHAKPVKDDRLHEVAGL